MATRSRCLLFRRCTALACLRARFGFGNLCYRCCPAHASVGAQAWWRTPSALLWLVVPLALGWLGLRVKPAAFTVHRRTVAVLNTLPLPTGLPAPVDRFYREMYGGRLPIISTAELTGRGWLRLFGLRWPARFRFVHEAGRSFRSRIEVTWFGLPLLKVDESFVDGHGRMRTPFGESPSDTRLDHGSELRLWAETATWLPPVLVTDWRVRWSPVDDATALLHVPTAAGTDTFVMRFDPGTGWPHLLESMRYRGTEERKTLWLCELRDWRPVSGQKMAETGVVTWADQGRPWASFTVEEVVYNANGA